jgi:hypothetical protein
MAGSRLYVSGWFERIAGAARYHVAALDVGSGQATGFRVTDAPSPVVQLVVSPMAVYARGGSYFCDLVASIRRAGDTILLLDQKPRNHPVQNV